MFAALKVENNAAARRRRHERRGRTAELVGCAWLLLKGYRILARRVRTRAGEIDIVAARGKRLAFVEVKLRPSRDAAERAITTRQSRRMSRAASAWLTAHRAYANHRLSFDAVLLTPFGLPTHVAHALEQL